MQNFKSQKGASMTEYALILSILAIMFLIMAQFLDTSARSRAKKSTDVENSIVPCDTGLTGEECL